MRKIEQQMINAISNNLNWKRDNTEVTYERGHVSKVYLHGNHIATVTDNDMTLYDGGWQSNTTKSRLNALLSKFGYTCGTQGEYIFQKDWCWYLTAYNDETNKVETHEFTSGTTLRG